MTKSVIGIPKVRSQLLQAHTLLWGVALYKSYLMQYFDSKAVHLGAGRSLHALYLLTFDSTVVHPGAGRSLHTLYLLTFNSTAVHPGAGISLHTLYLLI